MYGIFASTLANESTSPYCSSALQMALLMSDFKLHKCMVNRLSLHRLVFFSVELHCHVKDFPRSIQYPMHLLKLWPFNTYPCSRMTIDNLSATLLARSSYPYLTSVLTYALQAFHLAPIQRLNICERRSHSPRVHQGIRICTRAGPDGGEG
ncbi:hypothetical protein BT69DRAFT_521022 [Atractiella rhizophila]|nr:hypothetical protein BT69DRAFT_521022 [Atractiella rhizophila]